MNPLNAACYADRAIWCRAPVVENLVIAESTFRVRIPCPELARRIIPGQFVMLRLAERSDPLLARPFALYDTYRDAGELAGIDVVYLVKGRFTTAMSRCGAGTEVEIWGPLGNGFSSRPVEHLIMVAGGIGQTPFLALGAEFLGRKRFGEPERERGTARRVTFCYGARRSSMLAGLDDFRNQGIDVRVATDDGSAGHHGFVTDLLRQLLEGEVSLAQARIACCGPEPMMAAVARIAKEAGVACELSLETPMACGIGVCFTCVARIRTDHAEGWDYKRTCVEGPVFDATQVLL
ncbi:MAG: dihydroorotate dehydrogenase electron transfer subunit [Planctomycetes bacterium]|nr:dihydroorotate dehydrogenase electron transfer subunit [Planctomycetota bacterium]